MLENTLLIVVLVVCIVLYMKSEFDILREYCLSAWYRSCSEKTFYKSLTVHFCINLILLACTLIIIGGLIDNLQHAIEAVEPFTAFLIWICSFLGGFAVFRVALLGSYAQLSRSVQIDCVHSISIALGLVVGLMMLFCSVSLSAIIIHIGYKFVNL